MNFKRPRGTRDFGPEEMELRAHVEGSMVGVLKAFNYKKITTPSFEHIELFDVKSGTEIRQHMYVFKDKSGRDICLRPEATAPVCRMFASELRTRKRPLKLYYFGSMFRYERPQKGRYREFWQMGVELLGSNQTYSDIEVIQLACECLDKLGIGYKLEIGHVGISLRGVLVRLGVSEEDQDRIMLLVDKGDIEGVRKICNDDGFLDVMQLKGKNALTKARKIVSELYADNGPTGKQGQPPLSELEELEQIHLELVRLGKKHEINLGIARGLAYYTGMVFEIRVDGLGAQNQICGGGRYDRLIETFGGPPTPAVGFAFGFDRVLDSLEHQGMRIPEKIRTILVAPASEDVRGDAWLIAAGLRKKGVVVEADLMKRRLGALLEYASDTGVKSTVIVGQRELKDKKVMVKDMESGKQVLVETKNLAKYLTQ